MKFRAILAAISTNLMLQTSAFADSSEGTVSPATCGAGAQSDVVTLSGAQAKFGFGQSNKALLLSTSATAGISSGAQLRIVRPNTPNNVPNFDDFVVTFRDDGKARNNIQFDFCCTVDPRTHALNSFFRHLNSTDFDIKPIGNTGWFQANLKIAPKNFGLLDTTIRLTSAASSAQSFTFGDFALLDGTNWLRPETINLAGVSCCKLDACENCPP